MDALEVVIRPYRADDWKAVCAVHDRARPHELSGSVDPRAFRPMADVAKADRFFDSQTLVACAADDGGVVGFVSFAGSYLSWLYVDPAHHRRGVARKLLRAALAQIGPDAWTNARGGNDAAIRLYLGEGFRVVKSMESDCEGHASTCLRLALPTNRMSDPEAKPQQ